MNNSFFKIILVLSLSILPLNLSAENLPKWFAKPKNNNSSTIYGIGEGFSLEDATKNALVDSASRLMVSISSQSELVREENQISFNEELRSKVKQSIEKITFTGYEVSQSQEANNRFYVEVAIERENFTKQQQEQIEFIQRKINDLDTASLKTNPISRRNNLVKILDLCKELELKAQILSGLGTDINLKAILSLIAKYQNEFNKASDKFEFVFAPESDKDLVVNLRSALNKEKIKISKTIDKTNLNQILVHANYELKQQKVYGAYMAKLEINIENFFGDKILASNKFEVSGSSTIDEKEAVKSALSSLSEKITEDGVMKILGIIN